MYLGEETRDKVNKKGIFYSIFEDLQATRSWFDYVQYVGKNFLFDIRSSKTISSVLVMGKMLCLRISNFLGFVYIESHLTLYRKTRRSEGWNDSEITNGLSN